MSKAASPPGGAYRHIVGGTSCFIANDHPAEPKWRKSVRLNLLALCALLTMLADPSPTQARDRSQSSNASAARLSSITRDLSSDAFEGRAPGTTGEAGTIAYLTGYFQALGLSPGGTDGAWTQEVPLLHTRIDRSAPVRVEGSSTISALVQGEDIYLSTQRDIERAIVSRAPMVFVGYGINAPERDWDDFGDADVRGKILIFLVNDPDFMAAPDDPQAGRFGGRAMTYYGRWSYKFEEAARRGAAGALIVHNTDAAGYGWNTIISPLGENYDLSLQRSEDRLTIQGWLSATAAERLFAAAGLDLQGLQATARRQGFRPVELGNLTISVDAPVTRERLMSHNIIARIDGTRRPEETVVFAAHWDAFGATGTGGERRIRHGALDDAIGLAAVLELARMFKDGPAPERTLIFAAWTAEERGLLGSEHFVTSGLYPWDHMVANLTFDVLQPNGPARDFVLIGAGQSSLDENLTRAARSQGRVITADSRPERGLFFRADHFSFVKRGVPSLLFMALGGGVDLVNGGREAGERWVQEYTAHCYHQECDTWRAEWDLAGAAQDVDLAHQIGLELANSRTMPTWRTGSEFVGARADDGR